MTVLKGSTIIQFLYMQNIHLLFLEQMTVQLKMLESKRRGKKRR